jgi:hypothetical protein
VQKSGQRIRLTAHKKVPNKFQKFSFEFPAPAHEPKDQNPFKTCDPRAQKVAPCAQEVNSRVQAQALQTRDTRGFSLQHDPTRASSLTRDPRESSLKRNPHLSIWYPTRVSSLTRAPDQIRQYPYWVWTRNPNLGISSPSEAQFRPFKHCYNQYSEEHYSESIQTSFSL